MQVACRLHLKPQLDLHIFQMHLLPYHSFCHISKNLCTTYLLVGFIFSNIVLLLISVVSNELVLLSKLTSVLENPSNLQQEVHKLTNTRITSCTAASDKQCHSDQ